jgi:plastocyanin
MRTRSIAATGLAVLLTMPVSAQTEEASPTPEGTAARAATVEVIGVEYAFQGLPTSVPVGTTLTLTNGGEEIHELGLVRIADEVTETLEELMAMQAQGRDPMAEGLVEIVTPQFSLLAAPGMAAEGSVTLDREGRYIAICFIPQGMEAARLEELGVDLTALAPGTDPSTLSPEAQAFIQEVMDKPSHFTLGMLQEFRVTSVGSTPAPIPETGTAEPTQAGE